MKAVVMAGGEGSRLRPLTLTRPKPMLPVVNRPVLGHILSLLSKHGVDDVVMTLQYLAAQIQDYFGDGRSLGMNIDYVIEESPLGTAGSVKNAQSFLPRDEPFLVISGDALTDFDLSAILEFHRLHGALVTIGLYHVPDPLEYGVINVHDDGRIAQFQEKPSWGEVTSDTVNTGIYVVEPEVLDTIVEGETVDWSQHVFPRMLASKQQLFGYVTSGYWCDIGTLAEYRRANNDMLNGRVNLGPLGQHVGGGIWTGGSVGIASDAQLLGPIYLGEEVQIKSGVVIHGPSVVRDYTILDNRSRVDRSIIWRNCYIGEGVEIHGAVIGRQCSLKARSTVFEGAVVGDRTVIGEDAMIRSKVKIWPGKEVDSGATVNHSIIWGSQGRRVLFGRYGVTGVVNVDLTPDFVARLGAAFGSVLPKGSTVTINRDPNRSPRMIKRALVSGLPSSGNNVLDLRQLPIPVARYYTRAIGAAGGVHVRLSPYDERVVEIRFMGSDGLNLTREQERAVERLFFREDYRRAFMGDIGNIDYATDAVELYTRHYLQSLDVAAIRNRAFKVVVDYAHAPSADVLPALLTRLNVEVVPLNARVDADRISISQEEAVAARMQLATIAGALADIALGVRLDVGGERIFVVDDEGQVVPDAVMSLGMAVLVFLVHPGSTVVVPVDQTLMFERLAKEHGGYVRRCPLDAQALMRQAGQNGVAMACDGSGNYVFPGFHPGIDGLIAIGKLMELLTLRGVRLSEVLRDLPGFHTAIGQVDSIKETKGRVMRFLMQRFEKLSHETLDGIKVYIDDTRWILIRPDDEKAVMHLVAEAPTSVEAEAIISEYSRLVQDLVATASQGLQEQPGRSVVANA